MVEGLTEPLQIGKTYFLHFREGDTDKPYAKARFIRPIIRDPNPGAIFAYRDDKDHERIHVLNLNHYEMIVSEGNVILLSSLESIPGERRFSRTTGDEPEAIFANMDDKLLKEVGL